MTPQMGKDVNEENEDKVSARMRAHAISTVRYKVYIFFIIVIMVFIWPMITADADILRGEGSLDDAFSFGKLPVFFSNFMNNRWEEWGILNEIDVINEDIAAKNKEIENAVTVAEIIDSLNETGKQNTIISCLNNDDCTEIEESLLPFLPLFRAYLLVGNLQGKKMEFNQKVLLKNMNDFLLKTNAGLDNGTLNSVSFGKPEQVDERLWLYKIPISLSVEFPHQKMLLSFLHNVEEKIIFTLPVLYKIDALSFNIAEYTELQWVSISMHAYYIENLWGESDEEETDNEWDTLN